MLISGVGAEVKLPPRRNRGAGMEPRRVMVLDTVWCLKILGLAPLFNRYKNNMPRFPGTHSPFLSLQRWTVISKALILMFYTRWFPSPPIPNPFSCPLPLVQTGRITPFKKHTILSHSHQSVPHVATAWDCPSVLFSKAPVACTLLFQSWWNICSSFICLFGNVVVIPVTQCMDEKYNKTKRICI